MGRFAPPSRTVQVDVRLDEIVLSTLEKEPELRYQRARDVRTQVETLAGTSGLPASSRPSDQVPAPAGQGGRVARIGAVLLAAAPLLFGVLDRYRARWFFWVLLTAAVLMLFAFPVGTVLGVLLLIYVSQRRAKFFGEQYRFPAAGQAPATTVPSSGSAMPPTPPKSRWWIWLLVGLLLLIALPVMMLWFWLFTLG
jgi:hypothetical protein